ncbi:MAG: GAF domain-containing sensor histidine kinase [Chloroflexota bacterium]|jgi:signal transduction histidine kinase
MAKHEVAQTLSKEYGRFNWIIIGVLVFITLAQAVLYFLIYYILFPRPLSEWLVPLLMTTAVLLAVIVVVWLLLDKNQSNIAQQTEEFFQEELGELRAAHKRARQLQGMASVLRATLSFERVVEEALSICSQTLEEMSLSRRSIVGAVFLFNGRNLYPVTARQFNNQDLDRGIPGQQGIMGDALTNAEPTVTNEPGKDPELRHFSALRSCRTVVCIPLRTGFQIFGAIVIGSEKAIQFNSDHFKLFNAVADQAVIALQNAQLYQRLEQEKQRLIEADEEARKELARDLHDGPTQTIAAIAMRVNFIRSLLTRDPGQALEELEKVEQLAKKTSQEIRGMLFTLRPLVLETQGLGPAVESTISKLRETDGLNVRLQGGDHGELLSKPAQSVVFSIVEEALGNARKYAKAALIEVRFWQEDNLFVACVQDNGVGFDTAAVNANYSTRGSLGMVNMQERAERIEGSLRVESTPGRGTTVTLVVPLNKHGSQVNI